MAVFAAVCSVCAKPAIADAFTISEWLLGSSVYSPVGYDADYWYTVENPCLRTLSAQAGNSTSSSTLNFAWVQQFGTFLIQSQQQAVGAANGTTHASASGSITITPSVDLSLWLHGSYSFSLHGQMQTVLDVWVNDPIAHTDLFTSTQIYDTVLGPPYSRTFYVNSRLTLAAETTWVMGYAMEVLAWDGSTGLTGTGIGSVSFEISPEPATLALLAPLLLAVSHRAARRRRAPSP